MSIDAASNATKTPMRIIENKLRLFSGTRNANHLRLVTLKDSLEGNIAREYLYPPHIRRVIIANHHVVH